MYNIKILGKDNLSDVYEIAKRSFYHFRKNEFHVWDKDFILKKLSNLFMEGYCYGVFKKKECYGFLIATKFPSLYNGSHSQLVEYGIQPDPRHSKYTQSKVFLMLLDKYELISYETGCALCGMASSPHFDISRLLSKRNYCVYHTVYVKRSVENGLGLIGRGSCKKTS